MRILKSKHKNSLTQKTDDELVIEYKITFNAEVIGELYNRYHHIVFGISLKYLKNNDAANDALLQVFNDLFETLAKYEINDFKSWLLTVSRNYCIKLLKEESKNRQVIHEVDENISVDFMENEQEIALLVKKEQQLDLLESALKTLKPAQEKCVRMFYLSNKSYQEISEVTGFDIKKVKSYIQNGKRNLFIKLNSENDKK